MSSSANNRRRVPRQTCYAKVLIEGRHPGYLRDVSEDGCQIDLYFPLPQTGGNRLSLQVIPIESPSTPGFRLEGTLRWSRKEDFHYTAGIQLASFETAEAAEGYKKLLRRNFS